MRKIEWTDGLQPMAYANGRMGHCWCLEKQTASCIMIGLRNVQTGLVLQRDSYCTID
uniref:Uncharacterized protein n=1 Tax=Arundo donax TaxID=35708 RepID=A0A0A8YWS1_ARUDO